MVVFGLETLRVICEIPKGSGSIVVGRKDFVITGGKITVRIPIPGSPGPASIDETGPVLLV